MIHQRLHAVNIVEIVGWRIHDLLQHADQDNKLCALHNYGTRGILYFHMANHIGNKLAQRDLHSHKINGKCFHCFDV